MAKKTTKKEEPKKEEKKVEVKPEEKKTEEKKEEEKVETLKKYFVRDTNDRTYSKEANGFDLTLKAGEAKEVSKETAELCKKDFPYLSVSEV